jgi:glutaredoxin
MKTNKILVVYTMKGCPFCDIMKNMLSENDIAYHDLDIDENEQEYELFKEITQNEFVPAFMIIEEDTEKAKLFVPSRDYNEISEAIEIIKENLEI